MGIFNFEEERINYLTQLTIGGKGIPGLHDFGYESSEVFFDGVLAYTRRNSLYALGKNGEIIWKSEFTDGSKDGIGGQSLSNFKSLLFYPSGTKDIESDIQLLGIDIKTGSKRVLVKEPAIDSKNNMTSRMGAPVGYLFQNDTIVTFQVRKYGSLDGYRTDLVAWNITKNKQLWRVDSLDRKGNGSFNTPIYENEKIYYAGINNIYWLDAFTGELIWRQGFDNFNYQIIHHSLLSLDYGLIVKSHDNERHF